MFSRIPTLVFLITARLLADVSAGIAAQRARSAAADPEGDRGDVPGWVMITLMTAIVVIGLLTVFKTEVFAAVSNAFKSIS